MSRAALIALAALSFLGCSRATTPAPEPVVVSTPPGPAHACEQDADCQCSCTLGAVNWVWYEAHFDAEKECKDGCAAKGAACSCQDGACVAMLRGEPNAGCTRRDVDALLAPATGAGS